MKKVTYLLMATIVIMQLVACKQKATEKTSEALTTTDPKVLYSQIDLTVQNNTLSDSEKAAGWQLLSNGTDFSGWHGYNMKDIPSSWTIEDGCFTMKDAGGGESQDDILTDKTYKNFALYVEFKLTKAANSGILFQIKEDTIYKYAYETGAEYQVIDQEGWPDKLEDWQISGANYAMYPPKVKPYRPVGEWNQAFIVVNGDSVTHMLNGEITVQYVKHSEEWKKLRNSGKWADFPDYGKYDEGHISLQNHGTKVWYKNVMLKELN